jgi:hypothetical protein
MMILVLTSLSALSEAAGSTPPYGIDFDSREFFLDFMTDLLARFGQCFLDKFHTPPQRQRLAFPIPQMAVQKILPGGYQ